MTNNKIIKLNDKVISLHIDLCCALLELESAASDRLGFKVIADICNGTEIKFRRLLDDCVPDSESCILLEEVLSKDDKS